MTGGKVPPECGPIAVTGEYLSPAALCRALSGGCCGYSADLERSCSEFQRYFGRSVERRTKIIQSRVNLLTMVNPTGKISL